MSEFKGFKNSKVYVEGQGIIKTSIKVEDGVIKNFDYQVQ